jgi:hypothetical protein
MIAAGGLARARSVAQRLRKARFDEAKQRGALVGR